MSKRTAILPIYTTEGPNEAIELYTGLIEIEQEKQREKCDGILHFDWLPSPHVSLTVLASNSIAISQLTMIKVGEAVLHLPVIPTPINILIIENTQTSGPSGYSIKIRAHVNDEISLELGTHLNHVVFHLANFHELLGTVINADSSLWMGRVTVEVDGWRLTIDTVKQFRKLEKAVKNLKGYGITHAGKLERADTGTFTIQQARNLLDALFWFFSFTRGFWVSPILPVGYNAAGQRVWEEWHTLRIDPWQNGYSWFSKQQRLSQNLESSLVGFFQRWHDPLWKESLELAIHWYVSSNTYAGGVEGAIVLAQTGLELLSWVLLVEDQRKFTGGNPDRFDRGFSAARKIRELLNYIKVPTAVPSTLVALGSVATSMAWADGPDAITSFRNTLVHPSGRNSTRGVNFPARHEVLKLSLWYVELTLLYLTQVATVSGCP